MKQNRHTVDQIIAKLRRADVELGKGKKVPEICKLLEITDQTYYRWRQKYGGMQPEMAKELKALQKENARLKKLVADMALDNDILREAASGNFQARRSVDERLRMCANSWAMSEPQSVGPVRCWVSPVRPSVATPRSVMMSQFCSNES